MTPGRVVVVLGAESTGKTTLARALAAALRTEGRQVAVVDEYLREFCDAHGRTPREDEQAHIASEQTRRIAAAASAHELVIADTGALMVAVYSDLLFDDPCLYDGALAALRGAHLVLLTALDLPWTPDGLQRDGPHVRGPVDARVRAALLRAGIGFSVVAGEGDARLASALAAVRHRLDDSGDGAPLARWQWTCERCGDADCERHLLPRG